MHAMHTDTGGALPRFAFWAMIAAKLLSGWGMQWDIQWHVRVGRDTFWIAPHVMTYAGVTLIVLLSFGTLAWYTARGVRDPHVTRVLGLAGTRGFHLAAWGIALTVLAAPIDDLWHRLFGLDVTLWSPPHLLGFLGGTVNSAACLLIARELYPAPSRVRLLATVIGGAFLYGGLTTVAQPGFLLAYRYGGVAFYAPAILSALLLPPAMVAAAKLSGLRTAPVLVVLVVVGTSLAGQWIARAGFELVRPTSVIDEEIAKDPRRPSR